MTVQAQVATASLSRSSLDRLTFVLAPAGRLFFALAVVAFGALHLVYGDFVTRVVPWWPQWIPGRATLVWTLGVGLIGAGLALMAGAAVQRIGTALGALLLLSFLCLGLPLASTDSVLGGRWTVAGKALALAGGAFLVARSGAAGAQPAVPAWLRRLWSLGPWCLGAFLALCGVQHFVHVEFVTSLVPAWMLPDPRVWTYITGVALVAGGIGVVVPRTARLAALLSGLMIFAWVFLVHVPQVLELWPNANSTTAVFEALAMSGIAFLIAAPPQDTRHS